MGGLVIGHGNAGCGVHEELDAVGNGASLIGAAGGAGGAGGPLPSMIIDGSLTEGLLILM